MSDGTPAGVNASFAIDTREMRRLARKYGQDADRMLMDELTVGMGRAIQIAETEANRLIKGGAGSNLARAAKHKVMVARGVISAVADWDDAVSEEGFHYAAAVDRGRKAFGPKTKKALRWTQGGNVIFARHVKATPGQNFTGRGLDRARTQIMGEMNGAVARWARRMEALA